MPFRRAQFFLPRDSLLHSVLLFFLGAKRSEAAFEVGGTVLHEEGGEFGINAAIRPGFRNPDDTGGVCLQEGAKIFDVFGENDAALGDSQLKDRRVGKAGEIEVMLDVFDIKAFIEPRKKLAR